MIFKSVYWGKTHNHSVCSYKVSNLIYFDTGGCLWNYHLAYKIQDNFRYPRRFPQTTLTLLPADVVTGSGFCHR